MKKDWTKPKLISLYRGRPEEAVLNACKAVFQANGPDNVDETTGDCEVGSGNQCKDIVEGAS